MARMQGKATSDDVQYFAGVDMSKAHLDLRVSGTRRGERFRNDETGIAALIERLGLPHLVVFEPTGRYHTALWRALDHAGHGAAPCNPYRARHLAEGMGRLAKTDVIDALTLCDIALRLRPVCTSPPDDTALEIRVIYAARRALIKRLAMSRTQATANSNALVLSLLSAEHSFLAAQIKSLTATLTSLFKATSETRRALTRRAREILLSIPGIGEAAASAILPELPETGSASRGESAALTGTAPMTQKSGGWRGRARTRGGRRSLRTALHMPAIVAMTHNPDLKAFADRVRARGKNIFAVITATLRKLIILANTLIAQN